MTRMIDPTEHELAAIRSTMNLIGELMEEIGWQTRLADLTEQQVRALIEIAVEGFREALQDLVASDAGPEVPF